MKSCVMLLAFMILVSPALHAQGIGEWFNQKNTQTKYLLQQIAEFEIYFQLLKKGYNVAKQGLTLIGDIKHGDFSMHSDYFNSLKKVNPNVAGYAKIAAIMLLAKQVIAISKMDKGEVSGSKFYSPGEQQYVQALYEKLNEGVEDDLAFLSALVTDGKLTMKDGERISRVDELYTRMQERFVFARTFSEDHQLSGASRGQQLSELQTLQKLYNTPLP